LSAISAANTRGDQDGNTGNVFCIASRDRFSNIFLTELRPPLPRSNGRKKIGSVILAERRPHDGRDVHGGYGTDSRVAIPTATQSADADDGVLLRQPWANRICTLPSCKGTNPSAHQRGKETIVTRPPLAGAGQTIISFFDWRGLPPLPLTIFFTLASVEKIEE